MYKFKLMLTLLLLYCINIKSFAQCTPPTDPCTCVGVTLGPDADYCFGSVSPFTFTPSVSVPTGLTVTGFSWSPAGVSPSSGTGIPGSTTITSPTGTGSYPYTLTVNAIGPNMIVNGDFASGNSCFTSDYTYSNVYDIPTEGYYAVDVNPNLANFHYTTMSDHSATSPHNMLIAGGHMTPGMVVWRQTNIPVCAGAEYEFRMYAANTEFATTPFIAELQVVVKDASTSAVLYTSAGHVLPTTLALWDLISFSSSFGSATAVDIEITDLNTTPNANSFVIDDISLNRKCSSSATITINVGPSINITGGLVCAGSSTTFSATPSGGTWASSNAAVATVDVSSGVVYGVGGGTCNITYTLSNGCSSAISINVNPIITGPTDICEGATAAYFASTTGTWTSTGDITITTGSPANTVWITGNIVGPTGGMGVLTFTDPTGCSSSVNVYVNPVPTPIGSYWLCVGSSLNLNSTPPGGAWSVSPPGYATIVSGTGVITGTAPGATNIYYTLPTGCRSQGTVQIITCTGGGGVGGGTRICVGGTTQLVAVGVPAGGVWSSANNAIATVNPATGLVTGVFGGTVVISYTVGSTVISVTVTVVALPTACVTYSSTTGLFTITASCTGPMTIYFSLYDFTGYKIGDYTTAAPGTYTYFDLQSYYCPTIPCSYSGPGFVKICIDKVECDGCTGYSSCCASVNPTMIDHINSGAANLSIVPNPNNGTFTLAGTMEENSTDKTVKIEIVNILGEILHTAQSEVKNGNLHYDIELQNTIANGIYFVKVSNGNTSQVVRFVVNR